MKFLIFDMDGVLVDTCGCHARAYRDLWELCGIQGPPYSRIAGRPTVEVVAEFAPSAVLTERVAFKQQRAREYLRSETVVFEDVLPSLVAIEHAGIGMGVATGASRQTAQMLLELAGIARYFRFVLAAEDVRCGKPDPEVYRRAAELAETESMVVEDSASGLQAAVAAGLPVACVRSGLRVDSPLFLGSFAGLMEMLEGIGVQTRVERALIIPAAGRGSRLQSDLPKVLYPVAGRPMLDHLLELYAAVAERFVVVVSPEFADMVRAHCRQLALAERIDFAIQHKPDGMLPAILTASAFIAQWSPKQVWISWCDQVGIRSGTVQRMIELSAGRADLVFPTVWKSDPYIHFDRDADGRITAVRHRREGDAMPQTGESDSGLFALSLHAFLEELPRFAAEAVDGSSGSATGERNFLPFIPWIAQRGTVRTYALEDELESLGVNTVSDARQIEHYFATRA